MKILDIRTISGPNVYHHCPVLVMNLDLEKFAEVASSDLSEFTNRLLTLIPGLRNHRCSPRRSGGFVERLKEGTYFAHIIEHIGLELSVMAGIGVSYGKSIYNDAVGKYKVVVRTKNEEGMKFLMIKAVEIANMIAQNKQFNINSCIEEAKSIIRNSKLGPSTEAMLIAADKRNIPWRKLNDQNFIQLGFGKYRQFLQATTTGNTSDIAVDIAQDKNLTKKILEEASIRVPRGRPVQSIEEAYELQAEFPLPLAVKPVDGNHGRGVSINIKTPEELSVAFLEAQKISKIVMIEESLKGVDYRVLLVAGKMIAVAERCPAHVIGDGILSLKELIEKENENPLRGIGHENVLSKILIDQETMTLLQRHNLSLEYVPAVGEKFLLKDTANLSTGGIAIDRTEEIHPEIVEMCERAARVVGLDICGVDIIAEDISKPIHSQSLGIIELNAGPGIRMHHYPSFGKARDVGGAIMEHLYPNFSNGRIPIVSITGTNGKTTVARMLSHIVMAQKFCVGTTTTDGIYINNKKIFSGDTTGPVSARTVLSDPSVEIAILETARGGIVRKGLGYDWSDVGILTNVHPDHIGQDGIETVEDILHIKSLVIERVKSGGNVILNADSELIVSLTKETRCEIFNKKLTYFSLAENNPVVLNHLSHGGHAYFVRDHEIVEALGKHQSSIVHLDDIPLTFGGTADFHTANIMAVIAGAHALAIDDQTIIKGLQSFDQDKNSGRTNLYKVKSGFLLLDYGHNPDAFNSIGLMCRKWKISKLTSVVASPGDRSDDSMRKLGAAAARVFDNIIIREDDDLRDRAPGVAAELIWQGVEEANPKLKKQIILNSVDALNVAVKNMEENELIIYFYEDLQEIEDQLEEIGAEKCTDFSLLRLNSIEKSSEKKNRGDKWLQYSY